MDNTTILQGVIRTDKVNRFEIESRSNLYSISAQIVDHIVLFKSPYYTYAKILGSETGDLTETGSHKAYCFGPECYPDQTPPHDIIAIEGDWTITIAGVKWTPSDPPPEDWY